jgi:hypothetical protein
VYCTCMYFLSYDMNAHSPISLYINTLVAYPGDIVMLHRRELLRPTLENRVSQIMTVSWMERQFFCFGHQCACTVPSHTDLIQSPSLYFLNIFEIVNNIL